MVNGINSQQSSDIAQLQQSGRPQPSAEDMFKKLTEDIGGDGTTITKTDLDSYISKLESEGSDDKKLGFLKQLQSNFSTISGRKESITADDLKNNMDALKPPKGGPDGARPDSSKMFSELSQKIGADSNGITKENLQSYLEKLQSDSNSDSKETEFISKLIEDFDNISGGTDTITESSLQKAFQNTNSRYDWQDPTTVTSDQLQSPIDIKV